MRMPAVEADLLLLDEVPSSCTSSHQGSPASSLNGQKANSSSNMSGAAGLSASASVLKASSTATTSGAPTAQPQGGSISSAAASLTSLAALAAYKRQLYLGLDPTAAAGALGPGANRPISAAPLQAAPAGRNSFTLKSRPNGMSSPDFGSMHVPGCPRPDAQDTAAPSTAAQSGIPSMGALVPPRLYPRSCCPPPWPEPLAAAAEAEGPAVIAARQAEREGMEEPLINRLVYDSLQPAAPAAGREDCVPAGGVSGSSSSCRTTTSSKSLDVQQGGVGMGCSQTGVQQQAADYAYAPGLAPWYTPEGPADATLVFESRFESGNLRRAIQVTPYKYDLVLQPDINTRGHTQWFFFAVSNTRAGRQYRFNIINLLKEDSLYNNGMLPLMHSERQMRTKGIGWVRSGSNVCYGANNIVCRKKQTYYTLTLTVDFPYDQDTVHLAHCYPFTWTDQQNHIHALKKSLPPSTFVQHSRLATSLAGNAVDLLTITADPDRGKPLHLRQGVVLSARVHPGETNSSWMMKGALQHLLADTEEAAHLRETFVFKVVPMLNPDGVIVGNYRCSLAGLDLNRVYQAPDSATPVISAFKEMVRAFTQEREVVMSCDMHGHSRRFGIFMYGCEKKPGKDITPVAAGLPVPGSIGGLGCVPARHQERIFPLMLALNAPDLFSYRACNFKVQKSKAGTGRVVGFRELGLVNAFTMEASFAGAAVGKYAKQHFNAGHLEEMGAALVRTLLDYWAPPELNSAADLCSQLDAALLQGVTDTAGTNTGSSGSSGGPAVMGATFEKLLLGDGGEDEDVCTDSDDESSDDDKLTSSTARRGSAATTAPSQPAVGAVSSGGVDGGGSNGSSAASLADISRQLAELLGSKGAAAESGRALGAAGGGAAAGAVKSLLEAIRASEGSANAGAAAAAVPAPSNADKAKPAQAVAAGASSSSTVTGGGSAGSSSKQAGMAQTQTQAVTAAAQHLLDKLAVAKAKVQAGAVVVTPGASPAVAATGDRGSNVGPAVSLKAVSAVGGAAAAAVASSSCPTAVTSPGADVSASGTASPQRLLSPSADTSAPAALMPPAACAVAAAAVAGAAAAGAPAAGAPASLSEEEAALLVMPRLQDILQQLVQQTRQQQSKAAGTAKKKGRQKGRWGSPAVLRAARAKADAGLAAALPELGILDADMEEPEPAEAGSCWDDSGCSSASTSVPATPTPLDPPRQPLAGRRALTAGSRSSKGSSLDVERYMYVLEVQKRAMGGVLASSSMESGGVMSPASSQHTSSSPFGSSKSTSRKAVAFAAAEDQPDALEAVLVATGGSAAECPFPGVALQRRSKSAHPWLPAQTMQNVSE